MSVISRRNLFSTGCLVALVVADLAAAQSQPSRTLPSPLPTSPAEVSLVARSVVGPGAGQEIDRLTVRADGSFSSEQYMESHGGRAGKPWDELSGYFVVYERGKLVVSGPGSANEFEETAVPDLLEVAPGPVQWVRCPWPVLPKMVDWLEGASDLNVDVKNGVTTATSVERQLSITYKGEQLLRVLRGVESKDSFQSMQFADFGVQGAPGWMPTVGVWTIRVPGLQGRQIAQDVKFRLEFSTARDATDTSPLFDPVKFQSGRFDKASGDVFTPDGSRVLYNRNAVERAVRGDDSLSWVRTTLYIVGGLTLLVALILGVRKMKA